MSDLKSQKKSRPAYTVRDLVIDALCIALVLAFTMFVNLRLPIAANGGLIHLGNVPLFLAAYCFGRRTGALCGGLGMAAFDLISGWTLWAPFTLVIVGLMGYVVGALSEKFDHKFWALALGTVLALLIKIAGYYVAEGLIYGNWIAPVSSVPGNIVQIAVAMVIVLPLAIPVRKALGHIIRKEA